MKSLALSLLALLSCAANVYCGVVTTTTPKIITSTSITTPTPPSSSAVPSSPPPSTTTFKTTVKEPEVTTATPLPVTELPEELTTIIEIEEPEGNITESVDFVNLPGYGVVDDANSTANTSAFSCFNRRYGYYADIAKKCLMFHLCYPVQEPMTGQLIFQRFSFVCSDNAVFDQQHLVCVDNETLSYPCSDSHKYFIESNNKLIESMQQNAQQTYAQHPPQHQQYPGVASSQTNGQLAASVGEVSEADSEAGAASDVSLTADSDAEAAAQYALLEQLFG